MLTISQKLPIRKMAAYGSTAMLIGFMGTLVVLHQLAPINKNNQSGVAVVETINKKPSSTATELDSKKTEDMSRASATVVPSQEVFATQNAGLPAQQYPGVAATSPIYTPSSAPDPVATKPYIDESAPTVIVDGTSNDDTAQQQPAIQAPAVKPPVSGTVSTPDGLEIITNTTIPEGKTATSQ